MNNLKSRPFCGGEGVLDIDFVFLDDVGTDITKRYAVKCKNCKCGTPYFQNLEDAYYAWNKRDYRKLPF